MANATNIIQITPPNICTDSRHMMTNGNTIYANSLIVGIYANPRNL